MLQVEDVAGEVAGGMLLAPFTNIIEMDLGTKATHVPTSQKVVRGVGSGPSSF